LSVESLSVLEHATMDESELQKTITPDDENGSVHISIGRFLALRGQYENAREHFERAVELSPANAEAHLLRGLSLGQVGRYDEAGRELQQANDLRPDDDRAPTYLGVICRYRGAQLSTTPPRLVQEKSAVEMLRRAVNINPANRYAQRHLSHAEWDLQTTTEVYADLNSPTTPNASGCSLSALSAITFISLLSALGIMLILLCK
jgi:tetratricopeptide (TPR) repeat protein